MQTIHCKPMNGDKIIFLSLESRLSLLGESFTEQIHSESDVEVRQ